MHWSVEQTETGEISRDGGEPWTGAFKLAILIVERSVDVEAAKLNAYKTKGLPFFNFVG